MATNTGLANLLAERRALPLPELLTLAAAILQDLADAHSKGTFHGDIKPARIAAGEDGRYRLQGYGAGRFTTALYVAPERINGARPDARSDIYSLAAVLYHAATGQPPFYAETGADILAAHLNSPVQPPSQLKDSLPPEFDSVILRALAKNPNERFATAQEFASALASIPLPRAEPVEPARKPTVSPTAVPPRQPVTPTRPAPAPVVTARKRSKTGWLVPVIIIIALALFFSRTLLRPRVPSVVGLLPEEAARLLAKSGLKMTSSGQIDDTIPEGRIARQSPEPGTTASRGSSVTVRVSTGSVMLPALAGAELATATNQLTALGMRVRTEYRYSDRYPAGSVLSQSPAAGTRLPPRSEVVLTVVQGRATCSYCGRARDAGARFCTGCGRAFAD